MRLEAQTLDTLGHVLDLLLSGILFHHNDHWFFSGVEVASDTKRNKKTPVSDSPGLGVFRVYSALTYSAQPRN